MSIKWEQTVPEDQKVPDHILRELQRKPCVCANAVDEKNLTLLMRSDDDPREFKKVTCIHGKTLTIRTARRILGLKPWKLLREPMPRPSRSKHF